MSLSTSGASLLGNILKVLSELVKEQLELEIILNAA